MTAAVVVVALAAYLVVGCGFFLASVWLQERTGIDPVVDPEDGGMIAVIWPFVLAALAALLIVSGLARVARRVRRHARERALKRGNGE